MTTVSKLKTGTLTIDGTSFAAQATNVRLVPPAPPQGDDTLEVLSGDQLPAESGGGSGWTIALSAIQDWEDSAGLINKSWVDEGQTVPYVWEPMGADGPKFAGTVTIWPLELGGDVNRRTSVDVSWSLGEKPTRTEALP